MSFFENTRKPVGFGGKIMVAMMNLGHSPVARWGLRFLELAPDARVLDCGCGGGANIKRLLKKCPQGIVRGVDYSAVSVEKARNLNRTAIQKGRCAVWQGSVERIIFAKDWFDAVTAFETVYFWSDLPQCLREVRRVLKPGGTFAMAFLTGTKLPIGHVFFDGGQFAQIGKGTRRIMTPFLYFAIKSLYWSKGGTLKKILWCDDDSIKSYFIDAGKNLTYTNLRRQILDSLEDKPFPSLSKEMQRHIYFEFGSIEDHFKYRQTVMEAYPCGHYPVFEGYDHMQYQIRDPKGFAEMLASIAAHDGMPKLPFIRKCEDPI